MSEGLFTLEGKSNVNQSPRQPSFAFVPTAWAYKVSQVAALKAGFHREISKCC